MCQPNEWDAFFNLFWSSGVNLWHILFRFKCLGKEDTELTRARSKSGMPIFTPTNQIRFTNVAVVRYKKKGKRFEIACYMNKVSSWRNGLEKDISEVLQTVQVFSNVAKGQLASKEDILNCFESDDTSAICKEILLKGEYQLSEKERKHLIDSQFSDIASAIATKTINPKTKKPYTQSIIEKSMREIGYSVNINKSVKQQMLEVIKILSKDMPLIRSSIKAQITVENIYFEPVNTILKSVETGLTIESVVDGERETKIIVVLDPGNLKVVNAKINELVQNLKISTQTILFEVISLIEQPEL